MRDVWSSTDGAEWKQVTREAPWKELVPGVGVELNGALWVAEAHWTGHVRNLWSSRDGETWEELPEPPPWGWRKQFLAVTHERALWIVGGLRQVSRDSEYYLSDVWCSADGRNWLQVTRKAPWAGQWARWLSPQAVSFCETLWLLEGRSEDATSPREAWTFRIPRGGWRLLEIPPPPD